MWIHNLPILRLVYVVYFVQKRIKTLQNIPFIDIRSELPLFNHLKPGGYCFYRKLLTLKSLYLPKGCACVFHMIFFFNILHICLFIFQSLILLVETYLVLREIRTDIYT